MSKNDDKKKAKKDLAEGAGAAPEVGGGVVAAGDAGSDGASASDEPASRTPEQEAERAEAKEAVARYDAEIAAALATEGYEPGKDPELDATIERLRREREDLVREFLSDEEPKDPDFEQQLLNVHVEQLAAAHGIAPEDVNDPAARQVIGTALTGVEGPKTFRVFVADRIDDSILLDKVTATEGVDLGDTVTPDTYVVEPVFEDEAAELEAIGATPGRVSHIPIEQHQAFADDLPAALRSVGMRDINGDSQASDDHSSDDGESTAGAAPEAAPVEYSRGDTVLVNGRQLKVLESSELHLMCLTQNGSRQRVLRSDVQRWSAA